MAHPRLDMHKIREVLRLKFVSHMSRNAIARSVSAGMGTVSDYLARAKAAGITSWAQVENLPEDELERLLGFGAPPDAAMIDARDVARPLPDFSHAHSELKRAGVTLELLWQEYKAQYPEGYGYSQFCEHYSRWRKKLGATMRQIHRAGEKTFVDYSGNGLCFIDRVTGNRVSTQLFVGTLGASSYTFAEATLTQSLPDWLGSHVRMFEFFGGVTPLTVPDNLKSGVKEACFYDPVINPSYRDLASHYGTAILPARVRKPRDKAKVEAAVRFAQRWIVAKLRNRTFYSLSEINQAIQECLVQLNAKKMRNYEKSRRELYEQLDRPALLPLPGTPYEFSEWKKARVNIDYHVEFGRHFYSVPYALVRKPVEIRATQQAIEVFFKGRRVASHVRSFVKGAHTTDPAHMPSSHREFAEWTPSRMIRWGQEFGPSVAAVVKQILADKPHPEMGFRAVLGIIRLGKLYGKERLEKACKKALALRSPTYRTLKTMLANHREDEPLPATPSVEPPEAKPQAAAGQLVLFENPKKAYVRGKGYYH